MNILDIIGMSRREIEENLKENISSFNNMSCTMELRNIKCKYSKNGNHCLLYFDLSDRQTMNLAVVKILKYKPIIWLKIKLSLQKKYKGYVEFITLSPDKELLISYVQEEIAAVV